MKVRELIAHLSVCPPEVEVEPRLLGFGWSTPGHIINVCADHQEAIIEIEEIPYVPE